MSRHRQQNRQREHEDHHRDHDQIRDRNQDDSPMQVGRWRIKVKQAESLLEPTPDNYEVSIDLSPQFYPILDFLSWYVRKTFWLIGTEWIGFQRIPGGREGTGP